MAGMLTAAQLARYRQDRFLVLPGFVPAARCQELRERALQLAREHVPSPERATVFRADGASPHAAAEYFLTSGEAIRCFFEKDAFDASGALRAEAHLCLNKLGHAMHDLDPVFDAFSRTPELAAVAADVGMEQPLLLQSMYIFKQARIGGEVVCHTDHTYLWTEPPSVVGFWFAIDDATTENGCMWALPGGHRLPVKARSRLDAAGTATTMEVLDPAPYPSEDWCRWRPGAARSCCCTARCRTCPAPTRATSRGMRTRSTRSTAARTTCRITGCDAPHCRCGDSRTADGRHGKRGAKTSRSERTGAH